MNDNTTCNGWRNYPTWCAALWLYEYGYKLDDFGEFSEFRGCPEILAGRIESCIEGLQEAFAVNAPGMFSDLLGFALQNIDYYEIAENWLSDYEMSENWYSDCEVC